MTSTVTPPAKAWILRDAQNDRSQRLVCHIYAYLRPNHFNHRWHRYEPDRRHLRSSCWQSLILYSSETSVVKIPGSRMSRRETWKLCLLAPLHRCVEWITFSEFLHKLFVFVSFVKFVGGSNSLSWQPLLPAHLKWLG